MATKILKSLKGSRLRITRLDSAGDPVVGPSSVVVTTGFITIELSAEVETGEEYIQKNANGDLCISEKDQDRWKWVNTTMTFCEVNPDVLEIVGGAVLISDGTDTVGVEFTEDGQTDAFAIEVWTKQAGPDGSGSSPEWGYVLVPYITNGMLDDSVTIENDVLTVSLKGEGQKATDDWGTGPHGDNPLLASAGISEGSYFAVVRTTVQPPDVTEGAVALS